MQQSGPIDCDVHPAVPSLAALMPYLDDLGATPWSAAASTS